MPLSRGPTSKRPRSWHRVVMAGVAVVAVLGGAGLAGAAGSTGPPANAATATAYQVPTPSPMQPGSGRMGGPVPILHGQAVLSKPGGGYQTVDYQRGTVTAVSAGSITLKSTDGFTQSYGITGTTIVGAHRDGISSVKAGNMASVIATVSGKTVTATRIIDWTLLQHSHMPFGFGH
ncbi:MAG TPA: hypothetical protein VMA73_18485 [Streptosporangiaceae bacterium]|nr:hypothetical protein [Streptosporangiaceae bacterium]